MRLLLTIRTAGLPGGSDASRFSDRGGVSAFVLPSLGSFDSFGSGAAIRIASGRAVGGFDTAEPSPSPDSEFSGRITRRRELVSVLASVPLRGRARSDNN